MMATAAEQILKTILDEVKTIAKTETIIGEPINIANNTIIPVCKICIGFGGGGGEGEMKEKKGGGTGGGGGGGVKIDPAAFIVIKGEEVTVLGTKPGRLESLFETVPGIIDKIKEAKEARKAKKKEEEEKK
jgi:uncharacterized spore protein YtfJ